MSSGSLLDDIQDLNLSYLLLAQKLLRDDRTTALFRLRLNANQADFLEKLSSKQLMQLARNQQLICCFFVNEVTQLEQALFKPRLQGVEQLHAALLLSSIRGEQGA